MEIEWRGHGVEEAGILAGIDKNLSLGVVDVSAVNSRQGILKQSATDPDFSSVPSFGYSSCSVPLAGSVVVSIDPRYFRPTEVDFLMGDASRARNVLGWEPRVSFHKLVEIMVQDDIQSLLDLHRAQDVVYQIINGNGKEYGQEMRQ
jgi:GDPmannose 4,6-dehydratase